MPNLTTVSQLLDNGISAAVEAAEKGLILLYLS
jgi:hypothetical protein